MRTTVLLRHPECVIYLVECRFHVRASWIDTGSDGTELIYPLAGGFTLALDDRVSTCLPARLTVCNGEAHYQIRHFIRLPDRTLVIRLARPIEGARPGISHLFLSPAEAVGLHLLAATVSTAEAHGHGFMLPGIIARVVQRLQRSAIPHRVMGSEAAVALEVGLEHMLMHGGATTIGESARTARVGERRFRHGFRTVYATTPSFVRRTLRLAGATDYILAGGTATAAARISGFAHVSHLSGEFRRLANRTPLALLNAQRRCGMREVAALWECA